jgi:hypothetical protein
MRAPGPAHPPPPGVGLTRATVAVVLTAAAVAGCSGSGSGGPTTSPTPARTTPSIATTLPAHTGLVGAIDEARKVAVCANVALYTTTVAGGLTSSADEAFAAIIQTLKEGPREQGLDTLVRRWRRWRHKLGDAETAQRLTAFCSG